MNIFPDNNEFFFIKQSNEKDCGYACLRMIAKFYKKNIPKKIINNFVNHPQKEFSFYNLSEAAKIIGFKTETTQISYKALKNETSLPSIAHWKGCHFVVIYKIEKNKIYVADPAKGLISYSEKDFINGWEIITENKLSFGLILIFFPKA